MTMIDLPTIQNDGDVLWYWLLLQASVTTRMLYGVVVAATGVCCSLRPFVRMRELLRARAVIRMHHTWFEILFIPNSHRIQPFFWIWRERKNGFAGAHKIGIAFWIPTSSAGRLPKHHTTVLDPTTNRVRCTLKEDTTITSLEQIQDCFGLVQIY